MTHPYSIYIYQPPRNMQDTGKWIEQVQVFTQEYAIYLGDLIHKDSRSVIKVVRYGLTLASFPDKETVDRVERFLAKREYDPRNLL